MTTYNKHRHPKTPPVVPQSKNLATEKWVQQRLRELGKEVDVRTLDLIVKVVSDREREIIGAFALKLEQAKKLLNKQ